MVEAQEDLKKYVEGGDGIFVIRGSDTFRGWNNIRYKAGLSAKNVDSKKLSMNVATIPPGGVAYAHIHVDFEVMLYILEGRVRHEYGPGLKKVVENQAGDFIFIEPGIPHEVFNMSDTQPVKAVVARSDPNEWENIINYDRNSEARARAVVAVSRDSYNSRLLLNVPNYLRLMQRGRRGRFTAAKAHAARKRIVIVVPEAYEPGLTPRSGQAGTTHGAARRLPLNRAVRLGTIAA